ncbi:hypothetical protein E2562_007421 [Oryza meyeriana var. granulata]|uniref:Uncharacterized protein n=1 Tax=Oryza meyeriana var. granulata TaxID=110450 RepID=A0A6G1CYW6_9ORYZ|nr:hypothetical protein E2562_007421 [Oryza meyeriana var. granulata]
MLVRRRGRCSPAAVAAALPPPPPLARFRGRRGHCEAAARPPPRSPRSLLAHRQGRCRGRQGRECSPAAGAAAHPPPLPLLSRRSPGAEVVEAAARPLPRLPLARRRMR